VSCKLSKKFLRFLNSKKSASHCKIFSGVAKCFFWNLKGVQSLSPEDSAEKIDKESTFSQYFHQNKAEKIDYFNIANCWINFSLAWPFLFISKTKNSTVKNSFILQIIKSIVKLPLNTNITPQEKKFQIVLKSLLVTVTHSKKLWKFSLV
jgi:hypothetical protein